MVEFPCIDRATLLLGEQVRDGELLFLRLYDHDLADLASGERIYDWQVFLEDAELFPIAGVGCQLYKKLIHCFGVGFAVNQHHSSSDRIRLFFQPLPRIVQGPDGQGAHLTAFR